MSLIDAIIIIVILSGAIVGFKRGVITEAVSAVSFFASVVIAFLFKNTVSVFLYSHLPFFKFGGAIKGVTVLNIVLYELLAFLLTLAIVIVIFRLLVIITKFIEKFLKFTIILGFFSKILGAVLGLVESYVWVFIVIFILSLPIINVDLSDSKYTDKILNETIILSNFVEDNMEVADEFIDIKDKYENTDSPNEFNKETLDLLLKYEVVTIESIDQLIEDDKLKIDNIEEVLVNYRK